MSAPAGPSGAQARVAAAWARVDAREPQLHALIGQMRDASVVAARQSDARAAQGSPFSALDGVTVVVKDNIDIAGLPTTAGIAHYRSSRAAASAPLVTRLREAGAIIMGKANLHEAALGATGDNPWFGRCENPLRAGYTPGGSSSGSAAAVAAGYCELALGTDTMGSVRIPAAYCGVAGFMPTRGALSNDGVVPLSAELDQVGVLAPDAAGLTRAWYALRGTEYAHTALGFKGRRIGILPGLLGVELADGVAAMLHDAQACLRDAGAALVETQLPGWDAAALRRDSFLLCEIDGAKVHIAALASDPEGFSPQLRALFAYGAKQDPQRRARILERLRQAGQQFADLLDGLDLLLLPTCPQAAFAHGAQVPVNQADFTVPANLAGTPAISLPWGYDGNGMPLGLQLIARPGADEALLRMAGLLQALQSAQDGGAKA